MTKILSPAVYTQSPGERLALSRLRQLLSEPGLLQASIFQYRHTCGKSSCRCAVSKRHRHVSWYVGFSRKGGPQMKSLPKEWVEPIQTWIARRREIDGLLQKISKLYWARILRARR